MRLSIALSALAGGLTLGYAALADAAAAPPAGPLAAGPPPAAPIFYCPTPGAAAPAPAPAKSTTIGHARLSQVHDRAHPACPTMRREAAEHHRHWRMAPPEPRLAMGPPPPPMPPPPPRFVERDRDGRDRYGRDGDVSASQAFIYRYERALHGLNARAAEQAWGHRDGERDWDHDADHDAGRDIGRDRGARRGPPPRQGEEGARIAPDGRAWANEDHGRDVDRDRADLDRDHMDRDHMDGDHMVREEHEVIGRVDGDRDHLDRDQMARQAAGRVDGDRGDLDHDRGDEHRAYAWQGQVGPGEVAGGAYSYDRSVSERSGGWSYSERDGQGHAEHWGDADGARRGEGCPPSPDHGCAFAAGGDQWQDGSYGAVYEVSGRNAHGYLVWPGKTPEEATEPVR